MVEVLLRRRGRGRSDLYALSVLSFAAMGYRALGTGGTGVRFAPWAVAAILIVLLIANLEQGGWFRRGFRPLHRTRPGSARRSRRRHSCR